MSAEGLAARAAPLWSDRRLRIIVAVVGFAAVTLATALLAHPRIFLGFAPYDDEGYMLTAVKGFVNNGHLYDDVFTQYGPFYYEWWGGIFSLLGISVTHDSGRTMTMIVWVASSLIFGLSTWRMTASIVLGLGVQIVAFAALGVLTNEPMHPIGIIALLLSVLVAISCFVRERESPFAFALLGAALAALVLVKINIGFFAAVSVALACAVSYRQLWGRRWPRLLLETGFVAIPLLLMVGKFDQGWARQYAVHVALAALAVVLALRAREPGRRPAPELGWLVGGFAVLAVVSCLAIVGAGTSLHGLVDGVIGQPLRQADAFTIAMKLAGRFWGFDTVALAAAAAYWYVCRRGEEPGPLWRAIWSLFAIGVGATMAFSVSGSGFPFNANTLSGFPLSMLAFCWVGLIVFPGGDSGTAFARLLLPLLAVLQALHGYPVAGSQILLSAVLLVPVGALCIGNGVRGLFALMPAGSERTALAGFAVVLAVVLGWFVGNGYLREPLKAARANYDAGYPLGLPGASDVRLGSEEETETYRAISAAIRRDCPATVMEPGMDSFYLWAGQEPPSYTATGWETLFDEAHQRKVIEDTALIPHLCLLRNAPLQAGWGVGEGPLVSYLERGFQPIGKWGDYELLRREEVAGAGS